MQRVVRDPVRKLGWDDRLIGTMRLALQQGIQPHRYSVGAAAALVTIDRAVLDGTASLEGLLSPIWGNAGGIEERQIVLELIEEGRRGLQRWRDGGFGELDQALTAQTE